MIDMLFMSKPFLTKKLGVLVPSGNSRIEPDMYKMAPPGTSVHFARVRTRWETKAEVATMQRDVESSSEMLKDADVDVIAFGCMSYEGGRGYNEKIIRIIQRRTGIPGTAASSAVVSALKKMNLNRITVATPYEEWLNELEVKFLESHGISVLSIKGLDHIEQASFPPEKIVRFVMNIYDPHSQGVFISCTNFRSVEAIEKLERLLRRPVITSNQATMWMMLRMTRVVKPIRGYGKLLSQGLVT